MFSYLQVVFWASFLLGLAKGRSLGCFRRKEGVLACLLALIYKAKAEEDTLSLIKRGKLEHPTIYS